MTTTHAAPPAIDAKNVNEIWKNNFSVNNNNTTGKLCGRSKLIHLDAVKTSWAGLHNNVNNNNNQLVTVTADLNAKSGRNGVVHEDSDNSNSNGSNHAKLVEVEVEKYSNDDGNDGNDHLDAAEVASSPSHHARRPMNAFLIFCKKHRPIVRGQFPQLENRGVTRILGEWWSLLDAKDKDPYTELAKQYKDAFFTANPDFKWYKLPAPPLRTLPTRPTKVEHSPPISPITVNHNPGAVTQQNSSSSLPSGEFTPGKLADESQLGMLSSLFTANSYTKATESENLNNNNNNNNITDTIPTPSFVISPPSQDTCDISAPKPLKKRTVPDIDLQTETETVEGHEAGNDDAIDVGSNGRKSYRKGKGNRYADIMASGKLIKNKRSSMDKLPIADAPLPTKLKLTETIEKLQGRLAHHCNNNTATTSPQALSQSSGADTNADTTTTTTTTTNSNSSPHQPVAIHLNHSHNDLEVERIRTISEVSEMSDVADYSKAIPSFDLDARIVQLPNLSYDTYMQRKKEAKKRKLPKGNTKAAKHAKKLLPHTHKESQNHTNNLNHQARKRTFTEAQLNCKPNGNGIVRSEAEKQTGSKKRKNKNNITHLTSNTSINVFDDMSGLVTLAAVASNLSNNNTNALNLNKT